jgi:hypothetical protein
MGQENSQETLEFQQVEGTGSIDQEKTVNELNDEQIINSIKSNVETATKTFNYSQNQLQWMNQQVCNLERELLLNNRYTTTKQINNWAKVILTSVACILPGIGQIIGIILGLIFLSSDTNSDKRSFGAALLTISIIAFVIMSVFWFTIFLALGPELYY